MNWKYDNDSGTYLCGDKSGSGCGVWKEAEGWTGNASYGFDIENVGYYRTMNEACLACEQKLCEMKNNN